MVICDPSTSFTENRKRSFKSLFPPCSFGGCGGRGTGHLIVNAVFLHVAPASSLFQSAKSDRPHSSSNAPETDISEEEEL